MKRYKFTITTTPTKFDIEPGLYCMMQNISAIPIWFSFDIANAPSADDGLCMPLQWSSFNIDHNMNTGAFMACTASGSATLIVESA